MLRSLFVGALSLLPPMAASAHGLHASEGRIHVEHDRLRIVEHVPVEHLPELGDVSASRRLDLLHAHLLRAHPPLLLDLRLLDLRRDRLSELGPLELVMTSSTEAGDSGVAWVREWDKAGVSHVHLQLRRQVFERVGRRRELRLSVTENAMERSPLVVSSDAPAVLNLQLATTTARDDRCGEALLVDDAERARAPWVLVNVGSGLIETQVVLAFSLLERWEPVPRRERSVLQPSEQQAAYQVAASQLDGALVVRVNGEEHSTLDGGLLLQGLRDGSEDSPLHLPTAYFRESRAGLVDVDELVVEWTRFDARLPAVELVVEVEGICEQRRLTGESPGVRWRRGEGLSPTQRPPGRPASRPSASGAARRARPPG
ncbi:MAG: hypothetical protein AAF533_05050 [Acidobacteriota bacterium]